MSIKLQRESLRTSGRCRFVGVDEFLELAVSHHKLEWADNPTAGLRGLRNLSTGETVYVEDEKLNLALVHAIPR